MELQVGFSALLDRYPQIELADPDVVWKRSFIIRSIEDLHLRLQRR